MARTQKYSEEKLLEAVVRFSEVEKKKIKATELAAWCRKNVEGMEEVRDYHFMRPVKVRDEKTGRVTMAAKPCTARMEEINRSRNLVTGISTNLLLQAADIGSFMEQPVFLQRKMIVETREIVDRLLSRNQYLSRENEALKTENRNNLTELAVLGEKTETLIKSQERLDRQVTYLMKATDEAARKEMLSCMGVTDEGVNLTTYVQSLSQEINKVLDIRRVLTTRIVTEDAEQKKAKEDTLAEMVLPGIDFQEDNDGKM